MTAGANWGREPVQIVEIDQPFCTRSYGDAFGSPTGGCQARLGSTGTRKCYNTQATCQDTANYNPGTLTLRFVRSQPGLRRFYGNCIPSVTGISAAPASINLGGMDDKQSALGQREVVTVTFDDHRHSDLQVDKYRLERQLGSADGGSPVPESFDPFQRGTFWGKWLARNPYYSNYLLRVREGYVGDALTAMRTRLYYIDRIDGPNNGQVKLTAKDLFVKIDQEKAVAPTASRGSLAADLGGSPTPVSFTVTPSDFVDIDYPGDPGSPSNELFVRIGDEILRVRRPAGSATFNILQRGALGTTMADHSQEDAVQYVLRYVSQQAHNIVYDLLCTYSSLGATGSPSGSAFIIKSDWDVAAELLTELYTGTVATPTPVQDLIGELSEQAGFTVWPDVATGMIEFKALRAGTSSATLDDDSYLVDGSVSVKKMVDQRLSEIWVYYAQIDPTVELPEKTNYRSRLVVADLNAEASTQYGAPALREIFSRWIPQFGRNTASLAGNRLLAMFRDPPTVAQFNLTNERSDLVSLAGYVTLETASVQDASGAVLGVQHAVTEIEYGETELTLTSQSVSFAGASGGTSASGEIVIYIENDDYNLSLRTIYDSLYGAPASGSPSLSVRFIIESGIVIGSTSSGSSALSTGTWPAGVNLTLENRGRIQGKGGTGGNGAKLGTGLTGGTGGTALTVTAPLSLVNPTGQIWGGGGGGGGGGSYREGTEEISYLGGGGGGGGAGTNGGDVGNAGESSVSPSTPPSAGSIGTDTAGGAGGAGGIWSTHGSAAGGDGGGPGLVGSAGFSATTAGGSGGAAGKYIDGIANVTWVGSPTGDVRGNVA